MPASPLTRDLIEAGLRRPTGASPLTDAAQALEAARVAIAAAGMFSPGPQRDARLSDASLHLDSAKHHLAADRVRNDRSAA